MEPTVAAVPAATAATIKRPALLKLATCILGAASLFWACYSLAASIRDLALLGGALPAHSVQYLPAAVDLDGDCRGKLSEVDDGVSELRMVFTGSTLCITGHGFQSRAESTVELIRGGLELLRRDGTSLTPFVAPLRLHIMDMDDECNGEYAMAFAVPFTECSTALVPDFTFWSWPEAGLLPNFMGLVAKMDAVSINPPEVVRCGWAGNVQMNEQRGRFFNIASAYPELFDAIVPTANEGPGGTGGRISMEDQVRRWACMLDLSAAGYSGRLPLLLHSRRPVLIAARTGNKSTDLTWYAPKLVAWKHYIPVRADLSDLVDKASWVLDEKNVLEAGRIAEQAKLHAEQHLTLKAAQRGWADVLLSMSPAPSQAAVQRKKDTMQQRQEASAQPAGDLDEED